MSKFSSVLKKVALKKTELVKPTEELGAIENDESTDTRVIGRSRILQATRLGGLIGLGVVGILALRKLQNRRKDTEERDTEQKVQIID